MSIDSTHFILVRHGRTTWNREDRMRGRIDVPLDEVGIAQAQATAAALSSATIDAAYSSPLSRAMMTARTVVRDRGLDVIPFEAVNDFDFGQWQGLLRTEIRERWPDLYSVYEKDPASFTAPGGESLAACLVRSVAGLESLARKHAGRTVLVSSHAVVCQLALVGIMGLTAANYWSVRQGNCAVNRFDFGDRGWVLVVLNDTCHLI